MLARCPLFAPVCLAAVLSPVLIAQEPVPTPQNPQEKPKPADVPIPIPLDQEAVRRGVPVRDLTVEDALRMGRANNVDLHAAELRPQQAAMDLLVTEAVFNPELYGSVGYQDASSPSLNAFSPSSTSKTVDATLGWRQRVVTGGLFDLAFHPMRTDTVSSSGAFSPQLYTSNWVTSYTQPLLRSAWSDYNNAPISAARANVASSQFDFERTVQNTLQTIVTAYWELSFARENYRVVAASLQVAREQLRITNERIRVQELAARDRVADEAEVATRNEQMIVAENDIRRREDALRRLLFPDRQEGVWSYTLRPTSDIAVTPAVETLPWQDYADKAIEERPDLKSLRSLVSIAEQDLLRAGRDVLPELDLVSSYSSIGVNDQFPQAWQDSTEFPYPTWSVRLQFSIPIGNQSARAHRQRAELEVERRRRELYGAMLDVQTEIRDAVRSLESLAQSIVASGESVRLAATNLETEQVKLRVGSSTAFEVQRRNQSLQEARSRHLRNQLDYRVASSRLLQARGKLQAPPP
jgi:outer membrane protein TolC